MPVSISSCLRELDPCEYRSCAALSVHKLTSELDKKRGYKIIYSYIEEDEKVILTSR